MVRGPVARHERSLVDREHVVDHLAVLFDPVVGDVGSDRAYFRELSEFFKLTLSDSQLAGPQVVLRNPLALHSLLQNPDARLELLHQLLLLVRWLLVE